MRYELGNDGYISKVFFGCYSGTCTEYVLVEKGGKGTIPEGYETLEEWAETANIRAYKIEEGNLHYDLEKDVELQKQWAAEAEESKVSNYISSKGSNSNGSWIKYVDGTMEVTQRYKAEFDEVVEWGSMFAYSINNIKNYPQTFKELPTVSVTLSVSKINGLLCTNVETGVESTSRPCGYQLVRPTEKALEDTYINVIAKGKWK